MSFDQEHDAQRAQVGRGGWRPGSGRKPGSVNRTTAEVREIAQKYGPDAIEEAARLAGLVRDETGNQVGAATTERARIAALMIVLDRAYGRPMQPIVGEDGGPVGVSLFEDILRERIAAAKHE